MQIVVTIVTLFFIFFQVAPFIGISEEWMYTMFFISPFVLIYMVFVVLKNGEPSKYTFDERFYDDLDYKRNNIDPVGNE